MKTDATTYYVVMRANRETGDTLYLAEMTADPTWTVSQWAAKRYASYDDASYACEVAGYRSIVGTAQR